MPGKILLVITLLFISSAARSHAADQATYANDSIYKEAERAFVKGELPASLEKVNAYIAEKENGQPHSLKTLARAHNLKGLIYFQLKNLSAATQEFDRAVATAAANFPP